MVTVNPCLLEGHAKKAFLSQTFQRSETNFRLYSTMHRARRFSFLMEDKRLRISQNYSFLKRGIMSVALES